MLYAEVIVPLPLKGTYTYTIPDPYSNRISIGCRVIVQFGQKKFYTAIIQSIYKTDEAKDGIKEIITVLDNYPIILPEQIKFWEWISFYYICTLGEVYKAALPSALKLESETLVYLNSDFEAEHPLTPNEEKIFYSLNTNKPLRISEIEKATKISNAIPYIKNLAEKNAVLLSENIQNKYSNKTKTAIRLAKKYTKDELNEILKSLNRAKKQQELFLYFLGKREETDNTSFHIEKKELLTQPDISISALNGLIEKNILSSFNIEISRFDYGAENLSESKQLNKCQQVAYTEIYHHFKEKDTVLLHGVTSSGKTEIYIQLIKDQLEKGKQVLYLLPEIALTTQITTRLKYVFGDKLLVYHSKFNDNERAETWQTLLKSEEGKVVLGARSSIFLPFKKLGLIVIDEEHESSYKQQDPAPRYNAKNAAIILAKLFDAKVLLGSATPSIESYYNAQADRYGIVTLTKRFEEIALPLIHCVNTKELRKRKQMKSILSPILKEGIKNRIQQKEQVILFQNRRGFAPMLECKTCSWTPKCEHCDVSLTYHKRQRALVCHYCSAAYSIPTECPECKTPTLEILGYGTERVEELISEEIPEAKILRMDLDTTRNKKAYEHIITDFESNKANILIGTQMVSKGLDFDNVSLVGILNADNMLNYPDFRAHEKAFQLMMQVSGRAGRKNKQGEVLLQTAYPGHPIISFLQNYDYPSFYEMQIKERKLFKYPPLFRLIEVILKHKDESILETASSEYGRLLKESLHNRVLGPSKPAIARIQSLHIRKIILKIENQASSQKVREILELYQNYLFSIPQYKSILLYYDVDPM